MEEFFLKQWYGNDIKSWLISLGIIVGAIIVGKLMYWFCSKILKELTKKTKSRIDDILVDMLEEPIVLGIIVAGAWWGFSRLNSSEGVHTTVVNIFHVILTLNVTWLVARLFNSLVEEYIKPLTEKTESDLDDQLLPIAQKGISAILWTMGIIIALNNAGYDVGALIAGLGIGGLALAMAAKDTVSNIFGGFTIFTDKPFKINDRVRVGAFDGMITEIGIRSSRLKTLNGTLVTIPNSKITDSMVENVTLEPARKVILNLGLTYDTKPEKMQLAMDLLKEIAKEHKSVNDDYLVAFNQFGDFSLGILFIYYIIKDEDILQTMTDMNMAILTKFNENSLDFAFPTQTIQVEKE